MPFIAGEIRPIPTQGKTLNLNGILIYQPEKGNYASIDSINFNGCGAACSFSLFRYTVGTDKKILLYRIELNAGESLTDAIGYHLSGPQEEDSVIGDHFWLSPHSGKINYSFEGFEYEKTVINPPFASSGIISVIDKYGQQKFKCCGSDGSGYEYDCIDDTITEETQTYQNDKLIGAKDLKFILVDKTPLTEIDGDYTFDPVSGTITTISVIMYADSTIVAPFNRKL